MNVNDPAHLTEELLERLLASDDIETQQLLRLAGVSELYAGSGARGTTTIMDARQTMHAMMLDDAYCVERVLADGAYGVTEMVSLDGAGPFVRKKMPLRLARRRASPFRSSCATRRGTLCSGVVSMCVNQPKANPARSPSRSMVCPSTPPMRRAPMPRRCFSFERGTFVLLRRAICVQYNG